MTAGFAIPITTFVLSRIIQERVTLAYGAFPPPAVSIEPPPRTAAPANNGNGQQTQPEPPGLHLFLHSVSPNPALRNVHEPHVGPDGIRTGRSPLAPAHHYVLAVPGADLDREVLLGLGIVALTRFGILPRAKIAAILAAQPPPAQPQKLLDELTGERLDEQPSQITVTQAPMDVDLSTKIWSALQSPLRPSAHFLVTTVILDVDENIPAGPEVEKVVLGARPNPRPDPSMPADSVTITGGGP